MEGPVADLSRQNCIKPLFFFFLFIKKKKKEKNLLHVDKHAQGLKTSLIYYEMNCNIYKIWYLVLIVRPEHIVPIWEIWTLIQDHAVILWRNKAEVVTNPMLIVYSPSRGCRCDWIFPASPSQILGLFNMPFSCIYLFFLILPFQEAR